MSGLFTLVFAIVVLANSLCVSSTDDITCQRNDQCGPGYCCSMSEQRYSIPGCRKMRMAGEICRPNPHVLTNATFRYPDGSAIKVENGYMGICPCVSSCNKRTGTCN